MKMKKLFTAAAAAVMALTLAACSSSSESYSLSFDILNNKEGEVVIENADKDSAVSSGALAVGEGEEIVITSELEKGKVLIQIQKSAEANTEDTNDLEPPTFDHAEYEIEVEGSDIAHCVPVPGEYDVNVVMQDKTSGKITMLVQSLEGDGETAGEDGEQINWTDAATAEEAVQGAGIDDVADMNGTVISLGELGTMGDVTYKYMDGAVQVSCPAAAVEMFVIKAKASAVNGDASFDAAEYAHEWTQDVDGQEVKCFGNREGEATKTIWTAGDYSYAVLAYGAGGDDDYGLRAEDVAIMVNAVK